MDIQMPNLDGYGATQKIREHLSPLIRDVMIIAVTASTHDGDREKCLTVGMNDYLPKPIKLDALRKTLDLYLQ